MSTICSIDIFFFHSPLLCYTVAALTGEGMAGVTAAGAVAFGGYVDGGGVCGGVG